MGIRRRKIESLVEELLETYEITEAPVPVEMIAKGRGPGSTTNPLKMMCLDSSTAIRLR
jgi:hypothetical protein